MPSRCRHPQRVAQVTHTPQTSGTNALLIAVSPVNDRVVWVSGALGTYLRTTDGGRRGSAGRVPGADSLQFRDVHAVDANTAYLLSIGNGNQSRIYKTTDAGTNWTRQFTNPDSAGLLRLHGFLGRQPRRRHRRRASATRSRFSPPRTAAHTGPASRRHRCLRAQPNEGSFAASGTCLVTKPGGHAWIVASNPDHGRVLHTADFGETWSVDTLPITTRAARARSRSGFATRQRHRARWRQRRAAGDKFAARTSDGGHTWTPRTTPTARDRSLGRRVCPGANRPTVVAVGPAGAVCSRDEGVTWTPIDALNYWSVGFASPRAGWAVGTQGRITKLSGF